MAEQTPENDRVRGYLMSQGERYDYFEIWPRWVKARLQVLDSLQGVSDEQARIRPADGEWSINEVALHVLNGSRGVARLVELLAEGQPASSDRIDPPHEETNLTVGELHSQLLRDTIKWSALTERLPESPSFEATALHPFFGELHSRAWYLFQRIHDLDHYRQIEAIKNTHGYPSS
ncbi:MAG: DinB family protein [Chloroflexi bacterium]|nr:DinB family protein [Chloroflexota bacterium]